MDVRQVVPKDTIPSVDDPEFGSKYDGDTDDEVIVLDTDSEPRAYPIRYLHFHEIVNDEIQRDGESVPVAVTWCPLCGSAVIYDRRVGSHTLTFGVSGKLANDDLVMYDRETGSEWKQSMGQCIAGVHEGVELSVIPMSVTTWETYRETDPDGVVLQPPGGESEAASETADPDRIDYDRDPYAEYFDTDGFGLDAHHGGEGREWTREDIDPKTVVLGIERENEALGFPLPTVRNAGGVVTESVDGLSVVVFATDDGIHAFENPGFEFERTDNRRYVADGTTWDGVTGESEDGRQLDQIPARRLFAFAWQDDHGSDAFFQH